MINSTDILKKFVMKPAVDALRTFDMGNKQIYFYTDYSNPGGQNKALQACDAFYPFGDYELPYHYHDKGSVTYLIIKGQVELTLNGKICTCDEGDIINVPSHCPYGMKIIGKGALIREIYTDLDALGAYTDLELLGAGEFSSSCDPVYMEEKFAEEHHYFVLTEPVEKEKTEKAALAQITPKGASIYSYEGTEGIACSLKVGRWNLKRVREIWEYALDVNYQMQYSNPGGNERLYSIVSGSVMVEVRGRRYMAEANDIIHIPAYTPFTLTAAEAGTVISDLNVSTRLFRMLEMLELAQRDEPENAADAKWMKDLLELNGSDITGFTRTGFISADKF